MDEAASPVDTRRIVVVGPCASGKSTIATALRGLGFDARVCGQEHSAIHELWRRQVPDVLVALDIDLATVRRRRHPAWSEALFLTQHHRLRSAFSAADLTINAASTPVHRVVEHVITWLRQHPATADVRGAPLDDLR